MRTLAAAVIVGLWLGGVAMSQGLAIDARRFEFRPLPDITAYELAKALGPILGGDPRSVDALPPEVKRHFVPSQSDGG
jgi:hypothetical protein